MKTLNCKTEARRIEADALLKRKPKLSLVLPLADNLTISAKPVENHKPDHQENHKPEKKKALYRSSGKGSRSKVFISPYAFQRKSYCKSARGKGWMDAERATSGFKWNWYMHNHKTTPKVVLEWLKEHHASFFLAHPHSAANWWREKRSHCYGSFDHHKSDSAGARFDDPTKPIPWHHPHGEESLASSRNHQHTTHENVSCVSIANDNRVSVGNEGLNLFPGAWNRDDPRSGLAHGIHGNGSPISIPNQAPVNQNNNDVNLPISSVSASSSESGSNASAQIFFGDIGMIAANDNDGGSVSGNANAGNRKNSSRSNGIEPGVFVLGGAEMMNPGNNLAQNTSLGFENNGNNVLFFSSGNPGAGASGSKGLGIDGKVIEMNLSASHNRPESSSSSSQSGARMSKFKPRGYLSSFQKRVAQMKVAQGAAGMPQ